MTKFKHVIIASGMLALLSSASFAEPLPTATLDLTMMPATQIWGGLGLLTPLALDDQQKPAVVIVRMSAGTNAEAAHATNDGHIRFATVLSGTMYYSDGDSVDHAKEKAYSAGSMLLISSGTTHWLSTRDEGVVLMLTAVSPENLTPSVKAQLVQN